MIVTSAAAPTSSQSSLLGPCPASHDYATSSKRAQDLFRDPNSAAQVETITLISKTDFKSWSAKIGNATLTYLEALGMPVKGFPGAKTLILPGINAENDPNVVKYFAFYDDSSKADYKAFDGLWGALKPNKTYAFMNVNATDLDRDVADKLSISFALSKYSFNNFKSKPASPSDTTLVWPALCDQQVVLSFVRAHTLMKDLTETPALTLGPAELESVARAIAAETNVSYVASVVGVDELSKHNWPQIAAVGMAAAAGREPRIVDIRWDVPAAAGADVPEIVIIGKGVTFDTGGLNIKGMGMRQMKRDMAGAAQALALCTWMVSTKLPVKIRLLLPIAENSISGIALRPGDVIKARNGKTTEITNTDAEGRLILADALSAAVEGPMPALIVDFATLTGAARVALGAELPAIFSNNMEELHKLWNISTSINDPVWPLPLHEPMRANLKSSIADLVNAAEGQGGAITAALYLSEFISPKKAAANADESSSSSGADSVSDSGSGAEDAESKDVEQGKDPLSNNNMIWIHVDFPGAPLGLRAVYQYIKTHIAAAGDDKK